MILVLPWMTPLRCSDAGVDIVDQSCYKTNINLASALKSATIKTDDANIDDGVSKLTIKGKGQTDTLTDYIY